MIEKAPPQRQMAVAVTSPVRIELAGGQWLQVLRGDVEDVVRLVDRDGDTAFTLRLTGDGPVLRFEQGLTIETGETLALAGRRVDIRGTDGVSIHSGADATISVAGELNSTAHTQHLCARTGNVNVQANDDVRLNGERIKLNS